MKIQGVGQKVGAEYRGWRATCKHIYRHAGPTGFLRGLNTCIVLDVTRFGSFFITYEAIVGRHNWLGYEGTYSQLILRK